MSTPAISVIVTPGSSEQHATKVRTALEQATLARERFEVLFVEDTEGIDAGEARNRAVQRCKAPLVLFFDEGFVPASDLVEAHLRAHEESSGQAIVLGDTRFSAEALRSPLMRLLRATATLFEPEGRAAGELDWRHFWTGNISLPSEALHAAGGFTTTGARLSSFEDIELGYRLQEQGWTIQFHPKIRGQHDTAIDVQRFMERGVQMGQKRARLAEYTKDESLLGIGTQETTGDSLETRMLSTQLTVESVHADAKALGHYLEQFEKKHHDRPIPRTLQDEAQTIVTQIGSLASLRGLVREWNGSDPASVLEHGPEAGVLTSIIVVSYNALDKTRRCVEALRTTADPRHPQQIIVVDNGSSDGSVEYLASQSDILFLRNDDNTGAPAARNQALPHAKGTWICFLDNDAFVGPGWLERMRFHGEVDGQVGCVCPLSDRAAHGQEIPYPGGTDLESVHAFARERGQAFHRQMQYKILFPSFCVLVHQKVVEAIGGFDERFSPWGFEDDDFAFRAHLAGFRTRLAKDVFVRHETYSGPKLERHTELLMRNWKRFAEKWIPGPVPAYGELSRLDEVRKQTWSLEDLRIA